MSKKITFLFFAVLMMLCLFCVSFDAESYEYAYDIYHFENQSGIWINGEDITNGGTVKCGKGTAVLDKSKTPYKLTLTNAEITGWKVVDCGIYCNYGFGILSDKPLDIVLVGTNTVKITRDKFCIGIAAPGVTLSGDGTLSMKLKTEKPYIDANAYKSLFVQSSYGITSPYIDIYGGQYSFDCSDEINYISHAFQTDCLFIAKGSFSLFGSGGAFSKNPSYSVIGNAYPSFSMYSKVSSVKVGKSASNCSAGTKDDLKQYHKYVKFDVSAYCDEICIVSHGYPFIGYTAEEQSVIQFMKSADELSVKGMGWYDHSTGTKLSNASKFQAGKKYEFVIQITSPISDFFDNNTKIRELHNGATASGKVINQNGENVYVLTILCDAMEPFQPRVWINGERFSKNTNNSYIYDRNSQTLTLENANINKNILLSEDFCSGYAAVCSEKDLTVYLIGNNYINISVSNYSKKAYALICDGKITFEGNGTLTIVARGDNAYGIYANEIEFASQCKVNITSDVYGIYSYNSMTNNGELNVYGKDTGFFTENGDLINNGNMYFTSDNSPIYMWSWRRELKISSNQQILGAAKVNAGMAELTPADFDTSKCTVKSSGKEAHTVFIGIPGHIHIFNQQVASDEYLANYASCSEYKEYYYSCSCGEKDTAGKTFKSSEKGSHVFTCQCIEDRYLKSKATCKSPAVYYYKCENCNEHGTETFTYGAVAEHDFGSDGVCRVCGYKKPQEHSHSGKYVAPVEATCQKEGCKEYWVCSCGKIFSDKNCTKEITDRSTLTLAKTGHIPGEWIVDKEASVGTEGHKYHKCTVCNIILDEAAIPALKEECKHTNTVIQNAKEADCMKEGYTGDTVCADCGLLLQSGSLIPKTEHTAGDWITDKMAAVGEDGHRYKECIKCNTVIEEETIPALKEECKHTNTSVRNAKEATSTEDGYTGDKVCDDCGMTVEYGETVPKTGKDSDTQTEVPTSGPEVPTDVPEASTPAEQDSESGSKSGETNVLVWILLVLFVIALAVIAFLAVKLKKKG